MWLIPCGGSYIRSTLHRSASWPKKYLCIPATSTPAERVFSTCGNIVICHTVGQHWRQIQRTGLFFWHIIVTVMYTCQGQTALFKKQVGNASLFLWCMFIDTEFETGYLALKFLFHLQVHYWKMTADNLILLTVHVINCITQKQGALSFLFLAFRIWAILHLIYTPSYLKAVCNKEHKQFF